MSSDSFETSTVIGCCVTDSFETSTVIGCCVALESGVEPNNLNELSNSADDKPPSVRTSLNVQHITHTTENNYKVTDSSGNSDIFDF